MTIIKSTITSPEVIQLFSLHDDFIIDFLGQDSQYYSLFITISLRKVLRS